jgi:hypothetical protein
MTEEECESLMMCIRHAIHAMDDAAEEVKGIKGTKLKLWANNLKGYLPEELKKYEDSLKRI